MYYLLENNSIIDSENLPKNVKIERIVKDDKGKDLFIQIQYLDFLKTRKIGYIKKQSENVYALIEVGDLVRYFDNIYEIKKFEIEREIVYMDTQNGICFPSVTRFMELLNAIYKPDAKGNYIKAWEKKEDE